MKFEYTLPKVGPPLTKYQHVLHYTTNLSTLFFFFFLKIHAFYEKMFVLSTKLQNNFGILVGQAVFKLWIITVKIMF